MLKLAVCSEPGGWFSLHVCHHSQTERDVSVRQRAADLLYAMCDRTNAKQIVSEMLSYLETADYSIREEIVSRSSPGGSWKWGIGGFGSQSRFLRLGGFLGKPSQAWWTLEISGFSYSRDGGAGKDSQWLKGSVLPPGSPRCSRWLS